MPMVPEAYYGFIMNHAPYVYVIPPNTPDQQWGRAAFAAGFAVDFLYEARSSPQFEDRRAEIDGKITALADFILTQQCTDDDKLACGGFKSSENSTYYYSVDACRVMPSLLKAHLSIGNSAYLNAAKLAAGTFLYNMQHKPNELGVHDEYHGGFARAVTIGDAWLQQMDVESLYGGVGLEMIRELDPDHESVYEAIIADAVGFYRSGLEHFYLYYDPLPSGDADWHRTGTKEAEVYDDSFAYALLGLYERERWSSTVRTVYSFLNAIRAGPQYPAYNPAVCWAGYIDVVSRLPACDYYDAVTSGVLWKIRRDHDKPSFQFSMETVDKHHDEFMFWGVKHQDYSPVENKQAMATVCWLSTLYLNYEEPSTRFTQVLRSKGEDLTLYPVREAADEVSYGEPVCIKAIVSAGRIEEILTEPGYVMSDYLMAYTFVPVRNHDKIRLKGEDYEVQSTQGFTFAGETAYFKSVCRRLLGQ